MESIVVSWIEVSIEYSIKFKNNVHLLAQIYNSYRNLKKKANYILKIAFQNLYLKAKQIINKETNTIHGKNSLKIQR